MFVCLLVHHHHHHSHQPQKWTSYNVNRLVTKEEALIESIKRE